MKPRFTIIIPFLPGARGLSTLIPCLRSCLEQENLAEIRVVANFPHPPLREALKQFAPRVKADCAHGPGVNRARNLGARRSAGKLLLFLDDDCVLPHPGFLRDLGVLFTAHSGYSALGGGYASVAGAPWRVRGYNRLAGEWVRLDAGVGAVAETNNLLGGNACYRREVFMEAGGFDEDILSGGDESEFHLRLRRAGRKLGFSSELNVLHLADGSWRGLATRAWRQGVARSRFGLRSAASPPKKSAAFARAALGEPAFFCFALFHFPLLWAGHLAHHFRRIPGAEKLGP